MYVYIYIYVYICTFIIVSICIHICVYIYIYTPSLELLCVSLLRTYDLMFSFVSCLTYCDNDVVPLGFSCHPGSSAASVEAMRFRGHLASTIKHWHAL